MSDLSVLNVLLGDNKLQCVDVGARGGMQKHWRPFASLIDLDAFEPDGAACETQQKKAPKNEHWHPFALGDRDGDGDLFVVRKASSSSLYPPNEPIMEAYTPNGYGDLIKQIKVNLSRLSTIIDRFSRPSPNFIKLDVQGAELDVLKGLEDRHWGSLLGLQVEVEFVEQYKGQALFWEVDSFIRSQGFVLFDLLPVRIYRTKEGRELHYMKEYLGIARNRTDISRRLIAGDALYLRDPETILTSSPQVFAKYMAILLMYRCFDEAIWLAESVRKANGISEDSFSDLLRLIQALAPRPALWQRTGWIGKFTRRAMKRFGIGRARKFDFWLDRSWDF